MSGKLFDNVHNSEIGQSVTFSILLINRNDHRFDKLEDIKEEYIYIDVHMVGIDQLDCIILSFFFFFYLV